MDDSSKSRISTSEADELQSGLRTSLKSMITTEESGVRTRGLPAGLDAKSSTTQEEAVEFKSMAWLDWSQNKRITNVAGI